jgi:hypothetical protein
VLPIFIDLIGTSRIMSLWGSRGSGGEDLKNFKRNRGESHDAEHLRLVFSDPNAAKFKFAKILRGGPVGPVGDFRSAGRGEPADIRCGKE